LADVVGGNEVEVRPRDLDVVAEDLVVLELERGDPGLLALLRLQPREDLPPAGGQIDELVELGIPALAEDISLPGGGRELFLERPFEFAGQILETQERPPLPLEELRGAVPELGREGRELLEREAEGARITSVRRP